MKGTIVDLKKNVSKIKTKIEDHSDEILRAAYYTAGVIVGAVLTNRVYKKKLDDHKICHDFTVWTSRQLDEYPGEKQLIWYEEGIGFYIEPMKTED